MNSCKHEMVEYVGFTDRYMNCKFCGIKESDIGTQTYQSIRELPRGIPTSATGYTVPSQLSDIFKEAYSDYSRYCHRSPCINLTYTPKIQPIPLQDVSKELYDLYTRTAQQTVLTGEAKVYITENHTRLLPYPEDSVPPKDNESALQGKYFPVSAVNEEVPKDSWVGLCMQESTFKKLVTKALLAARTYAPETVVDNLLQDLRDAHAQVNDGY